MQLVQILLSFKTPRHSDLPGVFLDEPASASSLQLERTIMKSAFNTFVPGALALLLLLPTALQAKKSKPNKNWLTL
jgi:hypothetical protein